MNFLIGLSCLVFIATTVYSLWRNHNKEDTLKLLLDAIQPLVSGVAPGLNSVQMSEPNHSLAPNEREFIQETLLNNHGADIKYAEYQLRGKLEVLTIDILRRHTYHMSYNEAWAKAEEIVQAEFDNCDKPLSEAMMKILGTLSPEPDSAPTIASEPHPVQ